ncbi:MAG: hypothetical protein KAJ51_07180, partial [Thermoplasmata archaeon]|nr:hypothetical protein [Thermoplasmata archaeon]
MKKPGTRKGAKKTKSEVPGYEVCSKCNRPMYYYYPPMPPPTEPPKESNKVIYAVVITVVVIMVIIIVGIIGFFYSLTSLTHFEPEDETQEFKSEVIVADGEYFKHLLYDSWADEIEVKLDIESKGGEYFDVYIMDDQQFQNFYENQTVKSFASYYAKENIISVNDIVKLPSRY